MGFWGSRNETIFEDKFKFLIRSYLSRKFYLEGEQKDYYFGESIIGGLFTVFYNNNNINMKYVCKNAIDYAYEEVWKPYYEQGRASSEECYPVDLGDSAFNIPVYSNDRHWIIDDNDYYFRIFYMPPDVLENAIRKNPERWELYQKYKDEF